MILRDAWYRQMPGLMALAEEKAVLDRVLNGHRDRILLQIGGPNDARLIEHAHASHIIFLDTLYRTHHEKPYIQSALTQLPIDSDSIDTVLVMHALELSRKPELVLQEVYRILKPGGTMIISCFNRWSVWNLLHHMKRKKIFPGVGRCYSLSAIKKWIRATDAEIIVQQTVCFRPPFLRHDGAKRWLFLETLGQMIAPFFGAVSMVTATKKVVDMTPLIDMEWVKEMAMSKNGVLQPSSSRSYFRSE